MAILLLMPDGDRKPEPNEIDPTKLERLLDIELMQKRAAWQQAKASRNNLRTFSFLFLFVVIVGALLAFFFLFSSGEMTNLRPPAPPPEPPPTATPG